MAKRTRRTDPKVTAYDAEREAASLETGDERTLYLLSRPQLMQAASLHFGSIRVWRDYSKDELCSALATGNLPEPKEAKERDMSGKFITARYDGRCKGCGRATHAGEVIYWIPSTRKAYCQPCGDSIIATGWIPSFRAAYNELDETEAAPSSASEVEPIASIDSDQIESIARRVAKEVADKAVSAHNGTVAASIRTAVTDATTKIMAEIDARSPRPVVITYPDAPAVTIKMAHERFEFVLRLAALRMGIYLVGPMGTGKSTIGSQVAEAMGLPFATTSCYPQMSPVVLFGYKDAHGNYHRTEFRDAFENGGVFVLDEIDNGHSSTLAGLNQALANGHCGFPDGTVKKHPDFIVVATANTFGSGPTRQYVGRNPIDAATLDRFVKVTIEVDEKMESAAAHAVNPDTAQVNAWLTVVRQYRKNAERFGLTVGVSPRMSIEGSKMLAAGFTVDECKAVKLLDGLPDDVRRKLDGSAY